MSDATECTEFLLPGPAEALAGLIRLPVPELSSGQGLPLLWHWVYLLARPSQAALGPDGHPTKEGFPPPPGRGMRRMFAGGRVRSLGPLRVCELATRRSSVVGQSEKVGRSGRLTFVTVEHQILQRDRPVVIEQQDLVYRDSEATAWTAVHGLKAELAPSRQGQWSLEVDPVLLFRFSALTYNAHRIHYDRDYARRVEGYPGLVVHGPLQALAMAEAARRELGDMAGPVTFSYRLLSPLFDHEGLVVTSSSGVQGLQLAVQTKAGRACAEGAYALGSRN